MEDKAKQLMLYVEKGVFLSKIVTITVRHIFILISSHHISNVHSQDNEDTRSLMSNTRIYKATINPHLKSKISK